MFYAMAQKQLEEETPSHVFLSTKLFIRKLTIIAKGNSCLEITCQQPFPTMAS